MQRALASPTLRQMGEAPPTKLCAICGRQFEWRKKWAHNWDEVRYCSQQCRRTRLDGTDRALEQGLLELAATRGRAKTFCPSEVARQVAPADWRPLMERTRRAARRLIAQGKLEMLQRGRIVDPSRARGAIRLRVRG